MTNAYDTLLKQLHTPAPSVKHLRERWRTRRFEAVIAALDLIDDMDRKVAQCNSAFVHVGEEPARPLRKTDRA